MLFPKILGFERTQDIVSHLLCGDPVDYEPMGIHLRKADDRMVTASISFLKDGDREYEELHYAFELSEEGVRQCLLDALSELDEQEAFDGFQVVDHTMKVVGGDRGELFSFGDALEVLRKEKRKGTAEFDLFLMPAKKGRGEIIKKIDPVYNDIVNLVLAETKESELSSMSRDQLIELVQSGIRVNVMLREMMDDLQAERAKR